MKKLVLSLSLVLAFSSATAAFAAIPQNIRIGTDPTYAPFESKNSQARVSRCFKIFICPPVLS